MEVLVIARKVAKYIVAPVVCSLGYLLFYRSNVKNLKTQVKELQNKAERVKHEIETAKWDAQEIEPSVKDWISKVEEMIRKADAFDGDDKVSCPTLLQRHRLGKIRKKMTLEVIEILEKGNFNRVGYYPPPQATRPS